MSLLDRDMGGRKDEALGEVFIPIASFKEPKVLIGGSGHGAFELSHSKQL